MGEILKAFWQGICETPRAFFAPLSAALNSVKKVLESYDLRRGKRGDKYPARN